MIALGFVSAYCRDDNALAGCISGRLCSLVGHKGWSLVESSRGVGYELSPEVADFGVK